MTNAHAKKLLAAAGWTLGHKIRNREFVAYYEISGSAHFRCDAPTLAELCRNVAERAYDYAASNPGVIAGWSGR